MHNNVMQQRPSAQCLAAVGNLLYYVCYVIVVSVRNYLRMRLNSPPLAAHDGANVSVCYVVTHKYSIGVCRYLTQKYEIKSNLQNKLKEKRAELLNLKSARKV